MERLRVGSAALAALLLVMFAVGCAGTARGIKSSVYQHDDSVVLARETGSSANALVVIRYPAMLDEDAQGVYYTAFEYHPIGGEIRPDGDSAQKSDRIAQAVIAKSNYFAMSLYRELRDELPADQVLLSPHLVAVDDEGRLTSRPLLASEEIPSVLTIDFAVYSFPDPDKMMDAPPLTFGDVITPLFVIHSNRWLRPSTRGLLLSSEPLLGAAWDGAREQAREQTRNRLGDQPVEVKRPLDFVSYLNGDPRQGRDLPLKSAGEARRDVAAVEVHPLEKIRMDGELIARLDVDHSVDPFAEDFVKGAATRVVRALNRADLGRATFFSRQRALARFDPALARGFLARDTSPAVQARLRMARALIRAERSFLAAQSESLYEGTYEGTYGSQMREMITAEYRLLEERRELARAQNLGTALAILAMAGAVYAGGDSDSNNFLRSDTMGNLALLSSFWAVDYAISNHGMSKTIGENFLLQMAPAIKRQISVQVEWLESSEEISARDFNEFRAKALALYQRSVRSVDVPWQQDCRFRYGALEQTGRWFGACVDGQASGSGYGLVTDNAGSVVEYLGEARQGMPEGLGALIADLAGEEGATYVEGTFAGGFPDGQLWVEEPGRSPRVRLFRAGQDKGAGDPGALSRFGY